MLKHATFFTMQGLFGAVSLTLYYFSIEVRPLADVFELGMHTCCHWIWAPKTHVFVTTG